MMVIKREEPLIQTDTIRVRVMELLPVMLATCLIATVMYVIYYEWFAH